MIFQEWILPSLPLTTMPVSVEIECRHKKLLFENINMLKLEEDDTICRKISYHHLIWKGFGFVLIIKNQITKYIIYVNLLLFFIFDPW